MRIYPMLSCEIQCAIILLLGFQKMSGLISLVGAIGVSDVAGLVSLTLTRLIIPSHNI